MIMDTHTFTPSRPDGTVCVFECVPFDPRYGELCGYPAGHPIHAAAQANVSAATHGLQQAISPDGRKIWQHSCHVVHNSESAPASCSWCYLSGPWMPVYVRPASTPAEARTGISDRTAAALTAVAGLRDWVRGDEHLGEAGAYASLDLIERALREG